MSQTCTEQPTAQSGTGQHTRTPTNVHLQVVVKNGKGRNEQGAVVENNVDGVVRKGARLLRTANEGLPEEVRFMPNPEGQ